MPQSARNPQHLRGNGSFDGTTLGKLPANSNVIRIIHTQGRTKVVDIKGCKSSDEVIQFVLKKLSLDENHTKNYCFYVLDGLEADASHCRRLTQAELWRICSSNGRPERNRLILRKIHAGEPDHDQAIRASQLALEESHSTYSNAINSHNARSQVKLQKLTGESLDTARYPVSPPQHILSPIASQREAERNRIINSTVEDLEGNGPPGRFSSMAPKRDRIREFLGQRPPSEMVMQDMASFFPGHQKEEIEKTVRMSVRRSQRISRAASRLSVVSNTSYASSLKDAPPIPSIAESWFANAGQKGNDGRSSRPLSVSRIALSSNSFRDSIASSSLHPLQEESPIEPNRKSYVSFDSGSDSANATNNENNLKQQSYYEDSTASTDAGGSFNEELNQLIAEDGEEEDAMLNSFLSGDSWENIKWMQGAMIGQGSFGSVYLALHAVTGELMAVKQVDVPKTAKDTEMHKKKTNMVNALKQEVNLLRDLQHKNIVQYLGTSADEDHLNIFLEYVPGGSIAAMLTQYNTFPEPLIRSFVGQILEGLSYLHSRNIIHRDIKGANVLVDNKGSIKISDFGISKRVEASSVLTSAAKGGPLHRPSMQGSVFWMAPEVVKQTHHTARADIWSLGCLVVEMFSGSHPFPNSSQLQAIFQLGNEAKPTIPEECSKEAREFLERTFEIDHEKRPSADELLSSPFLKAIA